MSIRTNVESVHDFTMDDYLPSRAVPLGVPHQRKSAALVAASAPPQQQQQERSATRVAQETRFFANLPINGALINTSSMPLPPYSQAGLIVPPIAAQPRPSVANRSITSAVVPLMQASQQAHADNKLLREAQAEVNRLQNTVSELNRRLLLAGDRIAVLGHNRSADFASANEETRSLKTRLETVERERADLSNDNDLLQREVAEVKSKMQLAGEKMFEVQTSVVGESRVLQDEMERLRTEKAVTEKSLLEATERLDGAVQEAVDAYARETLTSSRLAEITSQHEVAIEALVEANSYRMALETKLKTNDIMLPDRPVELEHLSRTIGLATEMPVQPQKVEEAAPLTAPTASPVVASAAAPVASISVSRARRQHVVEVIGEHPESHLKLHNKMLDLGVEQHPVKGSYFFDDTETLEDAGSEMVLPGGLDIANTSDATQKSSMVMKAVVGDFSAVFFSKPLFARRPHQQRFDSLVRTTAVAVVVS